MPEVEPLRRTDPQRLGDFRLTGRLGEGGQGVVFRGESGPGEVVAVKLLHARLGEDPRAREGFGKAMAAAQKVDPFCTARILAAGVEGDAPYIVSEYIQGPSLLSAVGGHGPRSGDVLNRLALTTATALTSIHQAGVVHRDFKPSNVLLGPDGARVIDFGIARALGSDGQTPGGVTGTPAYMAPEQLSGRELTAAVDVWSWAATIVYASCGRPPFGQDAVPMVVSRVLHEQPDLGTLDGRLRHLVLECLVKDARERPSSQYVLMRLLSTDEGAPVAPLPPAAPTYSVPQQAPPYQVVPQQVAPHPRTTQPVAPVHPAAPAHLAADPAGTGGQPVMTGVPQGEAGQPQPDDSGIQVRIGRVGAGHERRAALGSRRAGRRTRMRNAGLGAALVILVCGLAAAVFLWSDSAGSQTYDGPEGDAGSPMPGTDAGPVNPPRTGPAIKVNATQGEVNALTLAAVNGGTTDRPLQKTGTPAPAGQTFAYADYVLTNTLGRAVLMPDLTSGPGDLFVKRALVPETLRPRCMPQAGAPADTCTLANEQRIIGLLGRSGAPTSQDGDQYMPAGASYLIRVETTLPVGKGVTRSDLGLYVWQPLYVPDRVARPIPFP
ncbi:serine/threonine protein kinase [Actinomadura scrupuli]|uniref:serine/threonine protein kinase n=1 Tax=Actinomadura scrupuli TaxID=559629 RepID=UPI003D957EC5